MIEQPPGPGPESDDFAAGEHRWYRDEWWSADSRRWWDGSQWQPRESHPKPPAPIAPRKRKPVARVISGIMHASVVGLLAVPLVTFQADCGGALDTHVSGFQAMGGFSLPEVPFPPFQPESPLVSFRSYGPNPLVWLVLAAALVGLALAWTRGSRAAAFRLVTAVTASIACWAAVTVSYPTFDYQGTTVYVDADVGVLFITGVLVIAILTDLLSLLVHAGRHATAWGPPPLPG